MSPTNIGTDKVTGTISKWFTNIAKMPPGKKLYAVLWLFTTITLIVEIGFQIAWANKPIGNQADAIAAVLIVFVVALFAAIATTVFVSIRIRRAKPQTVTSTTIKQGGKK